MLEPVVQSTKVTEIGFYHTILKLDEDGDRRRYHEFICSCGEVKEKLFNFRALHECEKCKNKFFQYLDDNDVKNQKMIQTSDFELLSKTDTGFVLKRTNITIQIIDKRIVLNKRNLEREIHYDMIARTLKVYRKGVLEFYSENGQTNDNSGNSSKSQLHKSSILIARGVADRNILNLISTEKNKYLIEHSYNRLSSNEQFLTGLNELNNPNKNWLQVLHNAGYKNPHRLQKGSRFSRATETHLELNFDASTPAKILILPKSLVGFMKDENLDYNHLNELRDFSKYFKNNNLLIELLGIAEDESTVKKFIDCLNDIKELTDVYGYSNIKKLVLYIMREVRMYQGIDNALDATSYLRDYNRMSETLNVDIEKYPKSLKRSHDLVMINYNAINQDERAKIEFAKVVERSNYSDLEFIPKKKDLDFAIVIPKEPKELVNEGSALSHCVGSYVKDVCSGRCQIVFLRRKDDIKKPLATVEIRGNQIRQASTKLNRKLSDEQNEFVKVWAKEKNLSVNYY